MDKFRGTLILKYGFVSNFYYMTIKFILLIQLQTIILQVNLHITAYM